jgi:hypothetical protein
MTETYKLSLLSISLTSEHWNVLYDLAADNKVTISDVASAALEEVLSRLLAESAYIDSLSASNDAA